jgi:hypothetical protein
MKRPSNYKYLGTPRVLTGLPVSGKKKPSGYTYFGKPSKPSMPKSGKSRPAGSPFNIT